MGTLNQSSLGSRLNVCGVEQEAAKMLPRSCRYRSKDLTWDLGEEMVWPRFLINFGVGGHC